MTRRIGLYSGTFDPIHKGHVAFAQMAQKECFLDMIVFLPETDPRGKKNVTDIAKRAQHIQQKIEHLPSLAVSILSSTQFNSRTTLPELRQLFPSADFTLLLGSDVVQTMPYRWDDLEMLLPEVSFAVGMRVDDTAETVTTVFDHLKEKYATDITYSLISTDHSHLASSQIRNRAAS